MIHSIFLKLNLNLFLIAKYLNLQKCISNMNFKFKINVCFVVKLYDSENFATKSKFRFVFE